MIGIVFIWTGIREEQRTFMLHHLRDFGFGKTSIEDEMMEEISDLISDITAETAKSDPVDT